MSEIGRARDSSSDGQGERVRLVERQAPVKLVVITSLSVFIGEVIVMLVLAALPEMPTFVEAMLDGLLITTLVTPVLLLFLFRPMVHQIEQRRAAEERLQLLNDQLEIRVEERTAELIAANEQLLREMADKLAAERGLSKSADFIRRVLAAAPCLLAMYDVNTMRCSFINERVDDLLGYAPDEALLKGPDFFKAIFPPDDFERFRELNMKIAAGIEQGITTCECQLRAADSRQVRFGIGIVVLASGATNEKNEVLLAAVPTGSGWPDATGGDEG
jgi:PAS domain-containing protein